ncbi:MAG TPA: PEP-CTERM sorting domain-containing protein [Albitalea sp.]|uniref:PEP-CTERM sorting domain-containing protein n=1 Tax=Piscinibacter sp. TaxID=1903157 RepID=UPI002ED460B8
MKRLPAVFRAAGLWRRATCIFAFLALHAPSQAQFVELPSGAFMDQLSGLVWRGGGGGTWAEAASAIPGFRLASISEVNALFDHAGIEVGFGSNRDGDGEFGAAAGLVHLFGCVLCQKVQGFDFWVLDAGPPGTHGRGSIFVDYDPSVNLFSWRAGCCGFAPDDFFDPMTSGGLFVQIVPEPQSWALLLAGLALLAAARWRRLRARSTA